MNSVAIGSVIGSETRINKVLQLEFYQGSSLLSAPEKANAVPRPLNGCHTAGINASDTKLLTPTEIAHTVWPRNNGAGIQKTLLEFSPLWTDTRSAIAANRTKHQPWFCLTDSWNHCCLNSYFWNRPARIKGPQNDGRVFKDAVFLLFPILQFRDHLHTAAIKIKARFRASQINLLNYSFFFQLNTGSWANNTEDGFQ